MNNVVHSAHLNRTIKKKRLGSINLLSSECVCLFDPMATEPGGRLLRRDDWHRGAADAQRHPERHHPLSTIRASILSAIHAHSTQVVVVAGTAWLPLLQGIHFFYSEYGETFKSRHLVRQTRRRDRRR
jgi:hypothetical protein